MEYTIKKMAELSGVSPRTLRFYDEIDLLKPARISSSGYRIYGSKEVDRLQHILFYRSLAFKLEQIREILDNPAFDHRQALREHQKMLQEKKSQIDTLLATVQQTLSNYEGETHMTDQEKFEGFKQQKLAENELYYGQEIREKYGNEAVHATTKKWQEMTEETYRAMETIEEQLLADLACYLQDPTNQQLEEAIFTAHKKWLAFSWPTYNLVAHKGLASMYLSDERFISYYDTRSGIGATKALTEIINKQNTHSPNNE